MRNSKLFKPIAYLIALVMAGAAFLLFWPEDSKKNDTYTVTAYFDKAIGLFPNSDVNVLGVPVGTIEAVEPLGRSVKVTMEVSKEYKIPADATAQIIPISVISDRYIEFAPAYTEGPALADGAEIPVERTVIPAELDDVFKQLKKLLDAIQPGKPGEPGALGDLIVELDETLSGHEDDLQGALTEGAELTDTLAGTKEDLQGLLANLDSLFGKLATRSGDFDTLNKNLILVLTAISESRDDLEGTLVNVGDLATEVTDVVKDEGDLLENDLRRLARVLRVVLKNDNSVRQSLSWLPVLGWGLNNAFHKRDAEGKWVGAVDVRDNATAKIECEIIKEIPDILDPIKDILEEICKSETGEPGGDPDPLPTVLPTPGDAQPTLPEAPVLKINCAEGVKEVKRQLRRIESLGLPDDVKQELLNPLRKKLQRLSKECEKIADKVDESDDLVDDVLDKLPDVPDAPDVNDTRDDIAGNAAGTTSVPTVDEEANDRNWFSDIMGFVGL